jgi:hypothetical protein
LLRGDGDVSSADFDTVYRAIGGTANIFDDLIDEHVTNKTDMNIARSQIGKTLR